MHKTVAAFAAAHPEHVFFKLDARKSYNSMWRSCCVEQASHDVPELAGFWSLSYARGVKQSRYLYRRDGRSFWVLSDAGVDQGDGLAPALFSFGMKAPANAFRRALQAKGVGRAIEGPILVLLYLDDIVVAVPKDLSNEVMPLASAAFGEGLPGVPGPGLDFAHEKTEAWCPAGGVRPAGVPSEVRWKAAGFIILGAALEDVSHPAGLLELGTAIGEDGNSLAAHFRGAAAAARHLLRRVVSLRVCREEISDVQGESVLNSVQTAQLLTRFCVEPKLLHLLSSTPPATIQAEVAAMDVDLKMAFCQLLNVDVVHDGDLAAQLGLPTKLGGVGVGTLGVRHAAAFVGSWALCLHGALTRLPADDSLALQQALLDPEHTRHSIAQHICRACDSLVGAGVARDRLPDWARCAEQPCPRRQAILSRACARATRESLLQTLPAEEAARVRSCGGRGAGGLYTNPANELAGTELPDGPFCFGARWRLGPDTAEEGSRCQIGCQRRQGQPCGAEVDSRGDHAAVCKCGGYKTIRHSRIVTTLRGILRESGAAVAPTEVPVHGWRRADGTGARLDVAYWADGMRHYVDVTIRHPRALKYRAAAALADGAAASEAERTKRQRYPAVADQGLSAVRPFALESFGRFGAEALAVLQDARQRVAERRGCHAAGGVASRWFGLLQCQLVLAQHEAAMAMQGARVAPVGMATLPFGQLQACA